MIPHNFHFVFGLKEQTEPFHLVYYLCLRSCLEIEKPDKVFFHYQHEPFGPYWEKIKPELICRKIEPNLWIEKFNYQKYQKGDHGPFRYAHLADLARLEILYQEGGFYADIDFLFVRPFPNSWFAESCVMGEEKAPGDAEGSLCNAFIAAEPQAPFLKLWLERFFAAFDGSWSNHSTLLPYRLSKEFPDSILVLPKNAFYAFDWTRPKIRDLFQHNLPIPSDAYGFHLWSHVWWMPTPTFKFHAGTMAPEQLFFKKTTYNQAAKQFLAEPNYSYARYVLQTWQLNLQHGGRKVCSRTFWTYLPKLFLQKFSDLKAKIL